VVNKNEENIWHVKQRIGNKKSTIQYQNVNTHIKVVLYMFYEGTQLEYTLDEGREQTHWATSTQDAESTRKRQKQRRNLPPQLLTKILSKPKSQDSDPHIERLMLDLRVRYGDSDSTSEASIRSSPAFACQSGVQDTVERACRDLRAKREETGKLRRMHLDTPRLPPEIPKNPFHFEVDLQQLTASFGRLQTNTEKKTSKCQPSSAKAVGPVGPKLDEWGVPTLPLFPDQPPPVFHTSRMGFRIAEPYNVYDHQLEAVEHARRCEHAEHRGMRGSIKFLEMGLGKSLISTILSVVDLAEKKANAPTLIVCPVSLIESWVCDTFLKFFPGSYRIMVLRKEFLRDKWDTLTEETLRTFDFVVTNYETISSVAKQEQLLASSTKSRRTSNSISTVVGAKLLFFITWHRIIADESQKFINAKSQLFQSMCLLRSRYKLCLTGTPFRNYDSDLLTPFQWLGYEDTPRVRDWNKARFESHEMWRALHIMDYDSAKVELPPKHTHIIKFQLTGMSLLLYQLLQDIVRQKNEQHQSEAFTALQLWRQVCVAPYLITPQASITLNNMPSAAEKRRMAIMEAMERSGDDDGDEARAKATPYLTFDETLAKQGKLSTLLLSLGTLSSHKEMLSTIVRVCHVYDDIPLTNRKAQTTKHKVPDFTKAARIGRDLDSWLDDMKGSAGTQSEKIKSILRLIDQDIPIEAKIIVFSTFSKAIELLKMTLTEHHGGSSDTFQAVTGSTPKPKRHACFQKFRLDPHCRLLLMTYGVGSVGLNLQEATHVIHMEPWWNNLDAKQGTCRVHRIGQTQEVHEWYLLVEDSVEEKIRKLQEDKEAKGKQLLSNRRDESGNQHQTWFVADENDANDIQNLQQVIKMEEDEER
jgi:SNF2 family DNA or RNA helicase